MLFILHPVKGAGTVILEEPVTLLTARVLEHTSREIHFLKISRKALTMPDESCLLLSPVHLFLTPFLI